MDQERCQKTELLKNQNQDVLAGTSPASNASDLLVAQQN